MENQRPECIIGAQDGDRCLMSEPRQTDISGPRLVLSETSIDQIHRHVNADPCAGLGVMADIESTRQSATTRDAQKTQVCKDFIEARPVSLGYEQVDVSGTIGLLFGIAP